MDTGQAIVVVAAIGGLVAVECMALHKGVNGKLASAVIGAIAFVTGYCFPK